MRRAIETVCAVLLVAVGSCGGDKHLTEPEVWLVSPVLTPSSTDTVGQSVLPAATVRVTVNGEPRAGATIKWVSSGGTVGQTESVTDADGRASVSWTLGTVPGPQELIATGPTGTSAVHFTVTAVPDRPASVRFASDSLVFTALSDSTQLAPVVTDRFGNAVTAPASWAVDSTRIAAVSTAGWVRATGNGTARVTATVDTAHAALRVVVRQEPFHVALTTLTSCMTALGDTVRLMASGTDRNGWPLASSTQTWASRDTTVAAADVYGLVHARRNGASWIVATVTSNGISKSDSTSACVQQAITSVQVQKHADTTNAIGFTRQLLATARDHNGATVEGQSYAWTSLDTAIATVDAAGVVLARSVGTARIRASAGAAADTATLFVRQVPVRMDVTPGGDTVYVGHGGTLIATLSDSMGTAIKNAAISWSSSDTSIVRVSAAGAITGMVPGAAWVRAVSSGFTDSARITVRLVPVASVVLTPNTADLWLGDSAMLSISILDSTGGALAGRAVTLATTDSTVAAVRANGVVHALAEGRALIVATSEGRSDTAVVVVHAPATFVTGQSNYLPYQTVRLQLDRPAMTDSLPATFGDSTIVLARLADSTFGFLVPANTPGGTHVMSFTDHGVLFTGVVVTATPMMPIADPAGYVGSIRSRSSAVLDSLEQVMNADTALVDRSSLLATIAAARDSLASSGAAMDSLTTEQVQFVAEWLRAHGVSSSGASSPSFSVTPFGDGLSYVINPLTHEACVGEPTPLQEYKCTWAHFAIELRDLTVLLGASTFALSAASKLIPAAGIGGVAVITGALLVVTIPTAIQAVVTLRTGWKLLQWTALASCAGVQLTFSIDGNSCVRYFLVSSAAPAGSAGMVSSLTTDPYSSPVSGRPLPIALEVAVRAMQSGDASSSLGWLRDAAAELVDYNSGVSVSRLRLPFGTATAWQRADSSNLSVQVVSNDSVRVSAVRGTADGIEVTFTTASSQPQTFAYDVIYSNGEQAPIRTRHQATLSIPTYDVRYADLTVIPDTIRFAPRATKAFVLANGDGTAATDVDHTQIVVPTITNGTVSLAVSRTQASFTISAEATSLEQPLLPFEIWYNGRRVRSFVARVVDAAEESGWASPTGRFIAVDDSVMYGDAMETPTPYDFMTKTGSLPMPTRWVNGVATALSGIDSLITYCGTEPKYYYVLDANESGTVMGRYLCNFNSQSGFFVWQNGIVRRLGARQMQQPIPLVSAVNAINAAGAMAGQVLRDTTGWQTYAAIVAADGSFQTLPDYSGASTSSARDLNNVGDVVGESGGMAVIWRNGTVEQINPPGAASSMAISVSDSGHVLVQVTSGVAATYLWYKGTFTALGFSATTGDVPTAHVNSRGQVVGQLERYGKHPFIWENGVLTLLPTAGTSLSNGGATSLRDDGLVGGFGANADNTGYVPMMWGQHLGTGSTP